MSASGAIYPCHTINAARVLSLLGYASDDRLRQTFDQLLGTLHDDGGWRCKKFSFGRGPETQYSTLVDGQIVVERVHRRLAGLTFCRKGEPSELGTARYQEVRANLAGR